MLFQNRPSWEPAVDYSIAAMRFAGLQQTQFVCQYSAGTGHRFQGNAVKSITAIVGTRKQRCFLRSGPVVRQPQPFRSPPCPVDNHAAVDRNCNTAAADSDHDLRRLLVPEKISGTSLVFDSLAACGAGCWNIDDMLLFARAVRNPPHGELGKAIDLAWWQRANWATSLYLAPAGCLHYGGQQCVNDRSFPH